MGFDIIGAGGERIFGVLLARGVALCVCGRDEKVTKRKHCVIDA